MHEGQFGQASSERSTRYVGNRRRGPDSLFATPPLAQGNLSQPPAAVARAPLWRLRRWRGVGLGNAWRRGERVESDFMLLPCAEGVVGGTAGVVAPDQMNSSSNWCTTRYFTGVSPTSSAAKWALPHSTLARSELRRSSLNDEPLVSATK